MDQARLEDTTLWGYELALFSLRAIGHTLTPGDQERLREIVLGVARGETTLFESTREEVTRVQADGTLTPEAKAQAVARLTDRGRLDKQMQAAAVRVIAATNRG